MKIVTKKPLLVGTAILTLVSAALLGCGNFLDTNAVPQGTLDEGTLSTSTGVEGTLIAAYRALDCPAAGGSSEPPPSQLATNLQLTTSRHITGGRPRARITSTRNGPSATRAYRERTLRCAC